MGYTHSWTVGKDVSDKTWKQFTGFVKQLIMASDVTIRNGQGENGPEIGNKEIWLNGDASCDEDHETFMIHRGSQSSDFCKTARKPYDVVVVASLAVAHNLGIITEWSSNGKKELGDFDNAMALLNKIGITEFK